MASETHNVGIGFDADITRVNKKINDLADNIQTLSAKLNKVGKNTNSINKTTQSLDKQSKQSKKTSKQIENLSNKQDKLNKSAKKNTKNIDKTNKKIKDNADATDKAKNSNDNFLSSQVKSMGTALRSISVWGLATGAIYGFKRQLQEMHTVMKDVNTEMIALRRVMNEATTDFNKIQKSAAKLGVRYASSIDEVVKSMVQWARQGKNQIQTLELTEAALLATNVAQMEAQESVDLLTAAVLQFDMQANEAVEVVDRLNETANNYATTASNLAMSIRESGAASKNAGISIDELIGITTSLSAATAKSGNRIGRALRTVFSRMMGDARNGGEALGKVETALNSVGISVRKTEDEYRSMTDVLTDLAVGWEDLDEVMQANIARTMGGRRRYSDVISLIENWDMALDATETSMNSLNSAMKENEKYMESMEAQWQQVRTQFEKLSLTVGRFGGKSLSIKLANGLEKVLVKIENFVVGINKVIKDIKKLHKTSVVFRQSAYILAGLLTATLLPALEKTFAIMAAHPVITIATLGVAAITTAIQKYGELQQKLEEAKDVQEDLNDAAERGNELSIERLENTQSIIDNYEDLIDKYKEAQTEIQKSDSAMVEIFKVISRGEGVLEGPINLLFKMFPEKAIDRIIESEKALDDLKIVFSDLWEGTSDIDSREDRIESFFNSIAKKLRNVEDEIKNSVSWIEKYTQREYDQVKQGVRTNKMLQEKVDRYFKLSQASKDSVEKQAELFKIEQELKKEFPKLSAAGSNFNKVLKKIIDDSMAKFGEKGTKIKETVNSFKEAINDLSESEDYLSNRQKEVSQQMGEIKEKLENTDSDKLEKKLKKLRVEFINLSDQLITTKKLKGNLKDKIEELENSYKNFGVKKFLSNFAKATNILEDFRDKVAEIEAKIQDLKLELNSDLGFAKWKADLQGLTDPEAMGLSIEQYKKARSEILKLGDELFHLKDVGNKKEVKLKIKRVISTMQSTEGMEEISNVSVDDIINNWDEEKYKSWIDGLLLTLEEKFINLDKTIDTKTIQKKVAELLEIPKDKINQLPDKELEEYIKNIQEIEDNLDKVKINNLTEFGSISFDIEQEGQLRKTEEDLKSIYDDLSSIVKVPMDEQPILNGTAQENVQELEDNISKVFDKILDLDVGSGSFEDQLNSLSDKDGDLKKTLQILARYKDLMDVGVISENAFNKIEGYNDLTKKQKEELDKLIERTREAKIVSEEYQKVIMQSSTRYQEASKQANEFDDNLTKLLTKDLSKMGEDEILQLMKDINSLTKDNKNLMGRWVDEGEFKKLINFYEIVSDKLKEIRKSQQRGAMHASMVEYEQKSVEQLQQTIDKISNMDFGGISKSSGLIDQLLGLDGTTAEQKKQIKKIIDSLKRNIEGTKSTWIDTVGDGIAEAINNFNEFDTFANKLQSVLQATLSGIFANEELVNDLTSLLNEGFSIGDNFDFSGLSEGTTNAIISGLSSVASGDSIATGALTTIGYMIGDKVGASIGNTVGKIGEAIFGGEEGESQSAVDSLKDQLDDAKDYLKDYNLDNLLPDSVKTKDDAGFFQKIFGGSDIEILNEEEIKEKIESIKGIISDMSGGIRDALTNAFTMNTREFGRAIEQSFGKALQKALIDSIMDKAFITNAMGKVTEVIAKITDDGKLTDEEISEYKKAISSAKVAMRQGKDMADQLKNIDGLNFNQDNTENNTQSFQAGSSTNVTYHQQFIVEAGAMMGDEQDAETFAEYMSSYIREAINREQGN